MRLLVQSRRDREADITIPPVVFSALSAAHGRASKSPCGPCHFEKQDLQSENAAQYMIKLALFAFSGVASAAGGCPRRRDAMDAPCGVQTPGT